MAGFGYDTEEEDPWVPIDDPNDPRLATMTLFGSPSQPVATPHPTAEFEPDTAEPVTMPGAEAPPSTPFVGDNRTMVFKSLQDHGVSPVASAAILGDIEQESSFDPHNVSDGGTSFGLLQVGHPLFKQYQRAAAAKGIGPDSPEFVYYQAPFILNRFRELHPDRWEAMQNASDAGEALKIFRGTKDWGYGIAGGRYDYARQYQEAIGQEALPGLPVAPGETRPIFGTPPKIQHPTPDFEPDTVEATNGAHPTPDFEPDKTLNLPEARVATPPGVPPPLLVGPQEAAAPPEEPGFPPYPEAGYNERQLLQFPQGPAEVGVPPMLGGAVEGYPGLAAVPFAEPIVTPPALPQDMLPWESGYGQFGIPQTAEQVENERLRREAPEAQLGEANWTPELTQTLSDIWQGGVGKAAKTGFSYGPPIVAARKLLPEGNWFRKLTEGVTEGVEPFAGGLVSQENMAIMGAMGPAGLPGAWGPAVSAAFAVDMGQHLPEMWKAIQEAPDLKSKTEIATQAVGTLLFAGGAGYHAYKGARNLRTTRMLEEFQHAKDVHTDALRQEFGKLQDQGSAAIKAGQPVAPEVSARMNEINAELNRFLAPGAEAPAAAPGAGETARVETPPPGATEHPFQRLTRFYVEQGLSEADAMQRAATELKAEAAAPPPAEGGPVEVIDQSHAAAKDPAAMGGIVQDALAIGHPVTVVGPDGKATPITGVDQATAEGIAKGTHKIEIGPRPGEAGGTAKAAAPTVEYEARDETRAGATPVKVASPQLPGANAKIQKEGEQPMVEVDLPAGVDHGEKINQALALSKNTKIPISWVRSATDTPLGFRGVHHEGRAFVNIDMLRSTDPLGVKPLHLIAAHEIQHGLKFAQPKLAARLLNTLATGRGLQAWRNKMRNELGYKGTDEQLANELAPEFIAEVLANPVRLRQALGEDVPLMRRVATYVMEQIDAMIRKLGGRKDASAMGAVRNLRASRKALLKMLEDVRKGVPMEAPEPGVPAGAAGRPGAARAPPRATAAAAAEPAREAERVQFSQRDWKTKTVWIGGKRRGTIDIDFKNKTATMTVDGRTVQLGDVEAANNPDLATRVARQLLEPPAEMAKEEEPGKVVTAGTRRFGSDARAKDSIESARRTIDFYTKGKGKDKTDPLSQQFLAKARADLALAQEYIADKTAVKHDIVNPPKQFTPKWNKDADVAKFFRDDAIKEVKKNFPEATDQDVARAVDKQLEDLIEAHRADNEGEKMGHDFWDDAMSQIASDIEPGAPAEMAKEESRLKSTGRVTPGPGQLELGRKRANLEATIEGYRRDLIKRGGRNYPELRISTRSPGGIKPKPEEDPHGTGDKALHVDMESIYRDKEYTRTLARKVKEWLPRELTKGVRNDRELIENAIEFFKRNKIAHYEMALAYPWFKRAMKQYEGYNIHGHNLSKEYGHAIDRILGGESSMSPQTPPDESFSMIERVMRTMRDAGNTKWDKRFDSTVALKKIPIEGKGSKPEVLAAREKYIKEHLRGKTYGELKDVDEKAIWIRVYDQTFHDPHFPVITPEGTTGELMKGEPNKAGIRKPYELRWRSFDQISRGIRALEGERLSNLLETAKVSSYYNSKIAPNELTPDWVADTHDIGTSWMFPVHAVPAFYADGTPKFKDGKRVMVEHPLVAMTFGGPTNKFLGHHGVSALHVEAGNRAAAELGIIPNELQAGIWSHQQGFMSASALRGNKQTIADIAKIWEDAARGKRKGKAYGENEARRDAIAAAKDALGQANAPTWDRDFEQPVGEIAEAGRAPGEPGELPGTRGPGRAGVERGRAADTRRAPPEFALEEAPPGQEERGFAEQLVKDVRLAEEVRDGLTNRFYTPISNKATLDEALALIKDRPVAETLNMLMDKTNKVPPRVRVKASQVTILRMNESIHRLNQAGDTAAAGLLTQRTIDLSDFLTEWGTEAGQGVAAFAGFKELTPQGKLGSIKRLVDKARQNYTEEHMAEIDQLKAKIDELTQTAKTDAERVAELKKLFGVNKVAKRAKPVLDKLIKAARTGRLTDQVFYDVVSERLGLPRYDRQVVADLTRMALAIDKAPAGIPQQKLIDEMHHYIATRMGFKASDLVQSIWFGNMLSGLGTHAVNIADTFNNTIANVNSLIAVRPLLGARIWYQTLRHGGARGIVAARRAIKGELTDTSGKIEQGQVSLGSVPTLELARFGVKGGVPLTTGPDASFLKRARIGVIRRIAESKVAYPLNLWKYVQRAMLAEDSVMYHPARQARATLLAYRAAEAEPGISGRALHRRVREMLGQTPEQLKTFALQADREGLTGVEKAARIHELQDELLPLESRADAEAWAGEATYRMKPKGVLGRMVESLDHLGNRGGFGQFIKIQVAPFARMAANVTNRNLNYTPWGFKRALYGYHYDAKAPTFDERVAFAVRASLGTSALVGAYMLQANGYVGIHGGGPRDPEKRQQLLNAGWKPYSWQIGSHFIPYNNTPMALPMGIIGNFSDPYRYHELDKKQALEASTYAMMRIPNVIASQSFLASMASWFGIIGADPNLGIATLKRWASTTAGNFSPRLIMDFHNLYDPTQYRADTIQQVILKNTPFASIANKPALSAFGEPVEKPRTFIGQRFVGTMSKDLAWQVVLNKGGKVTVADRYTKMPDGHGGTGQRTISPDESYELLEKSGPKIKAWILSRGMFIQDPVQFQKELEEKAREIREPILERLRRSARHNPVD